MASTPSPMPVGLIVVAVCILLGAITAVFMGVWTLAAIVAGPSGIPIGSYRLGGFMEVEAELRRAHAMQDLPAPDAEPVGIGGPGAVRVVFNDPDRIQYTVHHLPELLLTLLVLTVAYLAVRVLSAAAAGEVFVVANARRILAIALLVLIGGVLVQVAEYAVSAWLISTSPVAHLAAAPIDISLGPALFGLILLFFAEVFRRGVRLRADVEGLV